MKSKAFAAIVFASAMTLLAPGAASAAWSVSITYFQQELRPYGEWVYTASYGDLWRPTVVAAGWAPYTDGEWVWTECGWTWVSYDPFGEDPFHYGTWVWVDPYGWCWDPGYVWGPAWVTWAYTDTYIGWAPLPPTFVVTASGYAGAPVTVATTQYVFVPTGSFVGTNVSTVRVSSTQNATILGQASRVTRYSVSGGLVHATDPPASLIERATGKTLSRTTLAAHKLRAAPISSARMTSGRRISITAPKSDRAITTKAVKEGKPSGREAARRSAKASPSRAPATAHGSRSASIRKEAKRETKGAPIHTEKHASRAPAAPDRPAKVTKVRHETKPSGHGEKRPASAGSPTRPIHREAAPPAPVPRSAENKHQNPPPSRHEERSAAPQRPMSAPPAAPPREAKGAESHPAPPPAAAEKPHPQPPPQARGKKEKE